MKFKKNMGLILSSLLLYSCSMVKSPKSANFQRVKYNSHLNLASKKSDSQNQNLSTSKDEITQVKSTNTAEVQLEKRRTVSLEHKSSIENEPKGEKIASALPASDLIASSQARTVEESRALKNYFWTPTQGFKTLRSATIEAKGELDDLDEIGIGNLLYILLLVILVLVILGLILDLAGGLVGALLAVLIVLLCLRLLGYV